MVSDSARVIAHESAQVTEEGGNVRIWAAESVPVEADPIPSGGSPAAQ